MCRFFVQRRDGRNQHRRPPGFPARRHDGLRHRAALETGSAIHAVRYSADGRRLIIAGNSIRIWDAASGRALTPPIDLATPEAARASQPGVSDRSLDVALTPDGTLAAAAGGRTLRVWDASSGAPVAPEIPIESVYRIRWNSIHRLEMVSRTGSWVRSLDFQPDERPLAELQALAQLLSGRRIDDVAGPVAADFSSQSTAWHTLKGKAPELPAAPAESLVARALPHGD